MRLVGGRWVSPYRALYRSVDWRYRGSAARSLEGRPGQSGVAGSAIISAV